MTDYVLLEQTIWDTLTKILHNPITWVVILVGGVATVVLIREIRKRKGWLKGKG